MVHFQCNSFVIITLYINRTHCIIWHILFLHFLICYPFRSKLLHLIFVRYALVINRVMRVMPIHLMILCLACVSCIWKELSFGRCLPTFCVALLQIFPLVILNVPARRELHVRLDGNFWTKVLGISLSRYIFSKYRCRIYSNISCPRK